MWDATIGLFVFYVLFWFIRKKEKKYERKI